MDSWLDYKKLFESVDLYQLLDEVFKLNIVQKQVIELNQDQLYDGFDANNRRLITLKAEHEGGRYYYALNTVNIKIEKNQKYEAVTLKDTGDFYNSFGVIITKNGYEITANFMKEIMKNFDDETDPLGLTEESLAELVTGQVLYQLTKLVHQKFGI